MLDNEEWYDESLDRFYAKKSRFAEQPVVNQFDGMIHAQDGRIFDPVNGKEVDNESWALQTESNDWFDQDIVRSANEDTVNQFDGLIHTKDGRTFSPVDGKEAVNFDSNYVQTSDIYDDFLEQKHLTKQAK